MGLTLMLLLELELKPFKGSAGFQILSATTNAHSVLTDTSTVDMLNYIKLVAN